MKLPGYFKLEVKFGLRNVARDTCGAAGSNSANPFSECQMKFQPKRKVNSFVYIYITRLIGLTFYFLMMHPNIPNYDIQSIVLSFLHDLFCMKTMDEN